MNDWFESEIFTIYRIKIINWYELKLFKKIMKSKYKSTGKKVLYAVDSEIKINTCFIFLILNFIYDRLYLVYELTTHN